MKDVAVLAEQLSLSHLAFLREKERFERALAYDTPRYVPAPFDPIKFKCDASRTHAEADDLGRNWRFPPKSRGA